MFTLTRCLLLLFLSACCTAPQPQRNQLNICFHTYPNTLDPRKAGDFVSSTLICLIYDGLTRCLPGGSVELSLAEKVEVSEDKTVYTFTLRKACWSDGVPITAYDFEKSWKENLFPPSLNAFLFYPIKNGERCVKGEVAIDEVGILALDSRTLQVELERPTSYFYSLTAFPTFLPVPSHTNDPFVSSGPFQLERLVNHSEICLVKNKSFWNSAHFPLDAIHISIIPDETTALEMYQRGELDWLGGPLSPLPIDALENIKKEIVQIPSAATTFCTFNTETPPFSNLALRKAFSYAIDREEIGVLLNVENPSTFLPPSLTKEQIFLSDRELAKQYFEVGVKEVELNELILYYRPGQTERRLAQILQRQWKDILGITVQLVQLDHKSHAHRLHNRDYQMALASWIAQFEDPISILDRFKEKENLKNYSGWENPLYVDFLNQGLFQKAEALLTSEAPLTPIYHWSSAALCSDRIQATALTPCGGILFDRFQLSHAR